MGTDNILITSASAIGSVLVALALAPCLEGTIRKLKAVVQSRKGPPIIQPYLDILKLLGKEDLRVSRNWLLSAAPILFLASLLVAVALAPLLTGYTGSFGGDVIVFVYFVSLSAVALVLLGLASGSPYSVVGANREIMLLMVAEPVLVIALLAVAMDAGSLSFDAIIHHQLTAGPGLSSVIAAIALLLALQVQVAKLPFDMTEAETELMEGIFTEISGPKLALCKWGAYIKQFLYAGIFINVFLPTAVWWLPVPALRPVLAIAYVFAFNLIVVGVVDAVNPRLRIDQAMHYIMGLAVIAVLALAYAVMGA